MPAIIKDSMMNSKFLSGLVATVLVVAACGSTPAPTTPASVPSTGPVASVPATNNGTPPPQDSPAPSDWTGFTTTDGITAYLPTTFTPIEPVILFGVDQAARLASDGVNFAATDTRPEYGTIGTPYVAISTLPLYKDISKDNFDAWAFVEVTRRVEAGNGTVKDWGPVTFQSGPAYEFRVVIPAAKTGLAGDTYQLAYAIQTVNGPIIVWSTGYGESFTKLAPTLRQFAAGLQVAPVTP